MTERLASPQLRVGILALDGVMLSSVAGPADALQVADKLAQLRDPAAAPRFSSQIINARGHDTVSTSQGLALGGLTGPTTDIDLLLVPGVMHQSASDLCCRAGDLDAEIAYLRQLAAQGITIAAACSGTFLLAASGLLDGHRATTSWWLAAAFRRQFPRVQLEADQLVVRDGPLVTTGAATAVYEYILQLVGETGGVELAQQTSNMLVIDRERQSQAPYVSLAMIERPRHSLSEKADRYLRQALDSELSVAALAEHCGVSERSLLRHFRAHHGVTPLEYIQRLRVERAKAMLESTHLSLEEIVERCGYSDVSSFRKLFKRAASLTPGEYRERFRLRAH